MSAKTITIIILTVLLTVFLMINTDSVDFNFLVTTLAVSKLLIIGICILVGFILGYMTGRPKKPTIQSYDNEIEREKNKNELSDEDRDYIS